MSTAVVIASLAAYDATPIYEFNIRRCSDHDNDHFHTTERREEPCLTTKR